jgi:hypothetical protein
MRSNGLLVLEREMMSVPQHLTLLVAAIQNLRSQSQFINEGPQ